MLTDYREPYLEELREAGSHLPNVPVARLDLRTRPITSS